MPESTPTPAPSDRALADACTGVLTEIGRTDSKASLLLAFVGAVLAGLASLADNDLPTVARVLGGGAVAAFGAAVVLLLLVVRPRLGGGDRASFPYWATCTTGEVRASLLEEWRAERIGVLSRIAMRKMRLLQRAVDTVFVALVLLAAAAVATLAG